MQLKTILVPTDFSQCADEAVAYAAEIAKKFEASITLLNIFQTPIYPTPYGGEFALDEEVISKIREGAKEGIDKTKKKLEALGVRDVKGDVVEGNPADAIAEYASTKKLDMIVMGTHGFRGLKHWVLGSVAERVVRTANCPVLTVRNPQS